MKKKTIIICISAILMLIALDQVSKLFVDIFFEVPENADLLTNTLHIHPRINDEGINSVLPISEALSVNIYVILILRAIIFSVLFLVFVAALYGIHKFFFWDCNKKKYTVLNIAIFSLAAASEICSFYIDELFWGGSLDWICISWSGQKIVNGHYHPIAYHLTLDLKDIYVYIAILLLVVRLVLFIITYLKSDPQERKGFKQKEKHPLQNIKNMMAAEKEKKQGREIMKTNNLNIKSIFVFLCGNFAISYVIAIVFEEAVDFSGIYGINSVKQLIYENEQLVYNVVWEICFLIAFVLVNIVIYTAQKARRQKFLKDTKGLIPRKEGLIWHLKNYGQTELVILVSQSLVFLFICLVGYQNISPFGLIYRLCGVPFGFVVSVVLMGIIQMNHILYSQYHWRVHCYMHE